LTHTVYSMHRHIATYVDISKMQTMHQSRNDTLNTAQLLFTVKFIPKMTYFDVVA